MPGSFTISATLDALGYKTGKGKSSNYLEKGDLYRDLNHAHIFRRAIKECGLRGVYMLRPAKDARQSNVPVVYVCEAKDEDQAGEIHRLVWNQGLVPFVLVVSPRFVRLYSGFRHQSDAGSDEGRGLLENLDSFRQIADRLSDLSDRSIDSGGLWRNRKKQVTPDSKVDERLLKSLRDLDEYLQNEGPEKLDCSTSHALIGKFVYLRYLHDRGILSTERLGEWGITPGEIFSPEATLTAFWKVNDELHEWLNGSVFPLTTRKNSIKSAHVRKVAAVFFGELPSGQKHLDFQAYNFAFIPTETLSSIYQQFLHAPKEDGESHGKKLGAYYTPVPLVNFVLDELNKKRPLREGMKTLDGACGSGSFLVQVYRRLVELKRRKKAGGKLLLTELRTLLTDHIFGVEKDDDACMVTELSLILTLLDYADLPDLTNTNFKLPPLRDKNIFRADFFDRESAWAKASGSVRFDWIVGNPPWIDLKEGNAAEQPHAWKLLNDKSYVKSSPVGGKQLAELFTWEVCPLMEKDAAAGLIMPAMTLFKRESTAFRAKFFQQHDVWCVANFANFAEVLFGGRDRRPRRPAAVFFFSRTPPSPDSRILTYAPFVINQEANRPEPGEREATWNIVITSDEMRELEHEEVSTGDMLPWKIAMWGSHRDGKFIQRMRRNFPLFTMRAEGRPSFAERNAILLRQGIDLGRRPKNDEEKKQFEFMEELVGKQMLFMDGLRECPETFAFSEDCLLRISEEKAYLRVRGGRAGLAVSRPPHVVVDSARRFAVYTEDFVLVPSRQIGIAPQDEKDANPDCLRALSLYLMSDFAKYYQFFMSPAWGVDTSISILDALKSLPIPLDNLTPNDLADWASLHKRLVEASSVGGLFGGNRNPQELNRLLDDLNKRVNSLLGLRRNEALLISDLLNTKLPTLQGKVTKETVRQPNRDEMIAYLRVLRRELETFVDDGENFHNVAAVKWTDADSSGAIVEVEMVSAKHRKSEPEVTDAGSQTGRAMFKAGEKLLHGDSQWIYFRRGLRLYDGMKTFIYKPMQYIHWTRTQALLDAGEVIAETILGTGE